MTARPLVLTLLASLGLTLLPEVSVGAPVPTAVVQDTTRRPPPKTEPKKPTEKPKPTGTPVLRRRPAPPPPPPPPPPRPRPPSPIRP